MELRLFVSVTKKIFTDRNEKDKKENNVRFVFEISFFKCTKVLIKYYQMK